MNIEPGIGVLIKPSVEISKRIMEIKEEAGVYLPGYEDSLPHVTLYSSTFDEAKYPDLVTALEDLKSPAFIATIDELQFEEMKGRNNIFVSLNFKNKEQFIDLHTKVLSIANPLRGGLIRHKDIEARKNGRISDEGWAAVEKYGFQYFGERYYPHISIGSIAVDDSEKMGVLKTRLKELEGKTFPVDRFYVKLVRRTLPDQKKVFESENSPILLR